MPLLYDIGTRLYHTGIRAAALMRPKARQWVDGRRELHERITARQEALHGCLWMHCASVGEFEQGLPVLEAIRHEHPGLPVLVTFFSPSGYEARKAHPIATHVDYLPPDTAVNARWLVELIRPQVAIFVRYEFWHHHLTALQRSGVPTFLLAGIFRPQHPHFRWFGGTWRAMLRCFTHLFVQDERSRELLAGIGVTNVTVSGDTRFDRVAHVAETPGDLPIATAFRGGGPVLVCGSTWPEDESLLRDALNGLDRPLKCMVAPHELNEEALKRSEQLFPKPLVRWSEMEGTDPANIAAVLGPEAQGTLLVDRMGLLARLYQHGDIAYVGGGFGDGIHSLLEPAAWGKPVLFGPRHGKFAEAQGLIDAGGGFEVRDAASLRAHLLRLLNDEGFRRSASRAAADLVQQHRGATARVAGVIGADVERP